VSKTESPTLALERKITVRVLDASKTYADSGDEPVHALDCVSLDVRAGEMVALVGPSGCGKSTLLNLIGCVDLPSSGTIEVDGRSTSSLDDDALTALRRDRIGTVFQFFNLLPAMTIAENVGLPLVLQRRERGEIAERVRDALESVGIGAKANAYPSQVSGGQMQRAAVARATIHRPAVVLADEPTGNLDSQSGASVLRLLRDFAERGQAILMATHSSDAAAVCDRVVRMQDGHIVG
jgi:putative ABC transport system ATP-binding protein